MDQSIKRRQTIWPPKQDNTPRPAPINQYPTQAELDEHLAQVKEAQEKHAAPF